MLLTMMTSGFNLVMCSHVSQVLYTARGGLFRVLSEVDHEFTNLATMTLPPVIPEGTAPKRKVVLECILFSGSSLLEMVPHCCF